MCPLQDSLFAPVDVPGAPGKAASAVPTQVPLAERLRPQTLGEVIGQAHLLGPGKPLRVAFESGRIRSMILMGFGGVTALGCTIGQGLSGVSTLAFGSIITFFALVTGAALMMKIDYWRLMREA